MSTPNFSYTNRCIVVTEDDLLSNNVPVTETNSWINHTSAIIPTDFYFFDVVLTRGHYEAACIDYEEKEEDYTSILGYDLYYPNTKREFFDDMKYYFGLTEYRLRKLCAGINLKDFYYVEDFADALCQSVGEFLKKREEIKVDEYLDEIMRHYGYQEYSCIACFQNGEAIYSLKTSSNSGD